MTLPLYLYNAEQVKRGEVVAAQQAGIELYQLMLRAGEATFALVQEQYPKIAHITVVCGAGNNGGDGFVVARLAKEAGLDVDLFLTSDATRLLGDAAQAYQAWLTAGGRLTSFDKFETSLQSCDVIVDGILGTGLKGDVRANLASLFQTVNQANKPIVAIDLPSGLCADTGRILGAAICANHTISFIGLKQGLVTGDGRSVTGQLHFAGLEVEEQFIELYSPSAQLLDYHSVAELLPTRSPVAHKGDHGRVTCIGGNLGYAGAVRLCAQAVVRSGAGLTSALCHLDSIVPLQVACPEVMARDWNGSKRALSDRLNGQDVVAIGPGLGMDDWAKTAVQSINQLQIAKVVDADALNLLAQSPNRDGNRVITPHPGEAARLLAVSINDIESDRYAAVKALHQRYGGVVVLKGAGTLIFDGQTVFVCAAGNAGMASGGMGDVLTGVIAALIGQGLSISQAARLGVLVHSQAADDLVSTHGQIGLTASDLVPQIRRLLNGIHKS